MSGNHGTILTFMPASPQVAKGQMLELLLHNISDNYKFCSAIFNAKIVITAHWYSFPYLFIFFFCTFLIILAVPEEFQWENTQMAKNTGIPLKRPKKAKKGQQIKHSMIFLSFTWLQFLNDVNLHTTPWFTYVATCGFNSIMKPLKIKKDHLFSSCKQHPCN